MLHRISQAVARSSLATGSLLKCNSEHDINMGITLDLLSLTLKDFIISYKSQAGPLLHQGDLPGYPRMPENHGSNVAGKNSIEMNLAPNLRDFQSVGV